jgi:hypothetical protein
MPVIEAQRASILVPHDHRHINQKRASRSAVGLRRSRTQITRFGVASGGHLSNQAAEQIGGSARASQEPD